MLFLLFDRLQILKEKLKSLCLFLLKQKFYYFEESFYENLIIPLIFLLGVFVLFHPQFNIYDLILSLLCYIMYFTIENPDIKLLNEVTLIDPNLLILANIDWNWAVKPSLA